LGPIRATTTCLRKSFDFSGRATRAEFWWFAPIAVTLPVASVLYLPPQITGFGTLLAKVLMFGVLATPFIAAASRRFHDIGEPHDEFWRGIGPSLGVVVFGFTLAFGMFAISTIWGMLIGLMVAIPSFLLFLACLFIAPGTLGATIGQLLVPSSPGPNRYGPNPHEVSP
jgi:uncharacterized membrane protein YhaH (DUF805 family)